MRISDWSSDVCSSDLTACSCYMQQSDVLCVFANDDRQQVSRTKENSVMRAEKWACILAASLSLAACQTAIPPVEVTRFHIGDQTGRGTIAVEPLSFDDDTSLEFSSYAAAVGRDLQRIGFTARSEEHTSELPSTMRS